MLDGVLVDVVVAENGAEELATSMPGMSAPEYLLLAHNCAVDARANAQRHMNVK